MTMMTLVIEYSEPSHQYHNLPTKKLEEYVNLHPLRPTKERTLLDWSLTKKVRVFISEEPDVTSTPLKYTWKPGECYLDDWSETAVPEESKEVDPSTYRGEGGGVEYYLKSWGGAIIGTSGETT